MLKNCLKSMTNKASKGNEVLNNKETYSQPAYKNKKAPFWGASFLF